MFQPSSAIVRRIAAALMLIAMMHVGLRIAYAERLNVTDQIEYIGNPYLDRYPAESQTYARNMWDMIAFKGKLYIGAGNSSNIGPAPNAGPVPIISYDPIKRIFTEVFVVDEEQIDIFYIFNGKLFIPGNDPRDDWSYGNFYISETGNDWVKFRTIPNAIHTFALAMYQGKLFAALGTNNKKSIAFSENMGETWHPVLTPMGRFYSLIKVKNQLYALSWFYSGIIPKGIPDDLAKPVVSVLEFKDGNSFKPRKDLNDPKVLFPDTELGDILLSKIIKNVTFNDKCCYIGAKLYNEQQALPFGAYIASSLQKDNLIIHKIPLPLGYIPYDILVTNNDIYILSNKSEVQSTEVSVWKSHDGVSWDELFFFTASSFSRSFEKVGDNFVFSIGDEVQNIKNFNESLLSNSTGSLLQITYPKLNSHPQQ